MRKLCFLSLLALAVLPASAMAVVTTIYNIQLGYHAINDQVTVENVVVTGSGRFGFFIQEVNPHPVWGRMYSGIWVFTNGSHLGLVRRGDLVNVTGAYAEYFNFSEIDVYHAPCGTQYSCSYEVVGAASVPAPVGVRIADVNNIGPYNEAYESVLIRVDSADNTLFSRAPDAYDEWYIGTDPQQYPGVGDSILVDLYSADPEGDFDYTIPEEGTQLSYLQGMLVYNYSAFKIAPRNCPEDMGMACPPELRGLWAYSNTRVDLSFAVNVDEASAENEANYSFDSLLPVLSADRDDTNHRIVHLTTGPQTPGRVDVAYVEGVLSETGLVPMPPAEMTFAQGLTSIYAIQYVDDPVQDESPYYNIVCTVTGRVAAVEGNYYFLQEGDAGPYKSLYVRVARTGDLAVGDSVKVAGRVTEYYYSTYLSFTPGVQLYENLGPASSPVVTTDLPPTDLLYDSYNNGNLTEAWEDALVRIAPTPLVPAYVDSVNGESALYGDWWLLYGASLADSCRTDIIHPLNGDGEIHYRPTPGDSIIVTGICRYEYNIYRVVPRSQGDIEIIFGAGVGDDTALPAGQKLLTNRPNPFAATTAINFRLNSDAAAVSLEIFDVTGACVRHLLRSVPLQAGAHALSWDGRDDGGAPMAAGGYFYRLTVDGRSEARQMIRLD